MKIRFLEPAHRPYRPSPLNYFVYDRYIRTPSVGLNTLATIVKEKEEDTLMYSESISRIPFHDLEDADIIFIGIFTFAAVRGYQIADFLKKRTKAVIVLGGLHASMNYREAVRHCDYVLLGEGDETILLFLQALKGEIPMDFATSVCVFSMRYRITISFLSLTGSSVRISFSITLSIISAV